MNEMSVGEILKDFRSIKLSPEKRAYINKAREDFEEFGNLSFSVKTQLWKMAKHYKKQIDELHASRERAIRTNWRRNNGITMSQEAAMKNRRIKELEEKKNDIGI